MAWVFSANDRFANSFGEGAPLRSAPFSNDKFQAAAQTRFGVRLTCLKSPFAFAPDKSVGAFGSNIKKLVGAGGAGTTATHNSIMNVISRPGIGPAGHRAFAHAETRRGPHRHGAGLRPRRASRLRHAPPRLLPTPTRAEEDLAVTPG